MPVPQDFAFQCRSLCLMHHGIGFRAGSAHLAAFESADAARMVAPTATAEHLQQPNDRPREKLHTFGSSFPY
jgi:hypothetical protein